MKNRKVEITTGGKSLAGVKIERDIFLGDALSPLLFVIVLMTRNHILRKNTDVFKLTKFQEKINHFMYMDDIKLFAKSERKI